MDDQGEWMEALKKKNLYENKTYVPNSIRHVSFLTTKATQANS